MLVLILGWGLSACGADLKEAQRQFLAGNYSGSLALAEAGLQGSQDNEEWQLLRSRALLAMGRYPEAQQAITNALAQHRWSIRLRWQARQVYLSNGQTDAAREMTEALVGMVSKYAGDYRAAADLVVVGQAALVTGADPKRVLDALFEAARKADPKLREVYVASGGLALEKHDFALAAKRFEEGLKQLPNDPDLSYGLARAYAPSDQALMMASLEAALAQNSNHVGSLLLLVDHNIDAEDYSSAAKLLDRIEAVNAWHPEAWAYRAVLAHLQNQPRAEETARLAALKFWPTNPRVDYLIGRKLSQNYRFVEGAAHQRKALEFDPQYLPAKGQLAQDLLRLGEETEGWALAEQVQKQDGYDVEAFNLAALHETMGKFATLTNRDFVLRLSRHEASVYGERVLALLERARTNLCGKYAQELAPPTIVEVFPEQKDFAVRTFGMPGNPGYLGVCFGKLVTANSPAAHVGHAVNWEAVLWHEFCHVVTLQMTHNKMPRWLSEGISVFEECQANPAWGEHLNPSYREMILGDELTPVSKLSAAFLAPPSDLHLQFAYYESALVVEYLVQRFGLDQLKSILRDLGEGVEVNVAIEKHTAPMAEIEQEFATFAHERARNFGPGLDWEKPEFAKARGQAGRRLRPDSDKAPRRKPVPEGAEGQSESGGETWESWAKSRPTNFWVLSHQAQELVESKQWAEAKTVLQRLIQSCPELTGPESAYSALAEVHQELAETNAERQVLVRFAEKDAAAPKAYRRLMELASSTAAWPAVAQNAQRYLAVDPLVALPYRFLAQASEHTGHVDLAIASYRALLELDPPDPASVHFNLARLLHRAGDPGARRQVLLALEEAPRYRDALRLLLDINGEPPAGGTGAAARASGVEHP